MERFVSEDYKVSKWTGGVTRQLLILPDTAEYNNRDFDLRISTATVELYESDFTRLPGFDRVIVILDGKLVIEHEGRYQKELDTFESDSFKGEWVTRSKGCVTDFNVIFNGVYDPAVRVETKDVRQVEIFTPLVDEFVFCWKGRFRANGVQVRADQSVLVRENEEVLLDFEEETVLIRVELRKK